VPIIAVSGLNDAATLNDALLFGAMDYLVKPFELDAIRNLYSNAPGIILQDDPANNVYPLARTAENTDEVYVGRLRRDFSVDNGLNLWVVADNIRKGAASNAVQIAFELIKRNLI